MLSYQHGYHAGNFADVVKHFTLARILDYLCQKEKPVFYLETHSGKGLYDLKSVEAAKTGEAHQGIEQVWANQKQLPDVFRPYLDVIRMYNPDGLLRYYPGSPAFALQQLRQQDRLYCCELHPREFNALQQIPRQRREMKMHVSHTDGLEQLCALLPPPERRGLVFIDPSYEMKTDYRLIPEYIQNAYRRFNNGIYCIWYPILSEKSHIQMVSSIAKIGPRNLRVEFKLSDPAHPGMTGCGLWVINPPYVLAAELKVALSVLVTLLNPGISAFELRVIEE